MFHGHGVSILTYRLPEVITGRMETVRNKMKGCPNMLIVDWHTRSTQLCGLVASCRKCYVFVLHGDVGATFFTKLKSTGFNPQKSKVKGLKTKTRARVGGGL